MAVPFEDRTPVTLVRRGGEAARAAAVMRPTEAVRAADEYGAGTARGTECNG
jgi:hypothetical protein